MTRELEDLYGVYSMSKLSRLRRSGFWDVTHSFFGGSVA